MIKKILGISVLFLLSITIVNAEMICEENMQCSSMDFGDYRVVETSNGDIQMGTVSDSNFNFGFRYYSFVGSTRYSTPSLKLLYWWESDGLHYSSRYFDNSHGTNGKITGFYVCSQRPHIQSSNLTLASYSFCTFKHYLEMDTYLQGVNKYSASCNTTLSYANCMVCAFNSDSLNYICVDNSTTTGNDSEFLGIEDIEDRAISNPFSNNSSSPDYTFTGGNITDIRSDIDDYIQFYEDNFNWDINMCYVGTYDTGSVYGTPGIDFIYGSGNTIYGLYYGIYNSFGNNKIHNVGAFVNTYLLNYATWFETPVQERLYQATYNGPDQNVTYIYTGFTFPFADKPVAIYFMSDLLSERYITESSQGENIVFYCDMKLNYESYKNGSLSFTGIENLVDPKIKDRIEDWKSWGLPGTGGYSVPDNTGFWSTQIVSGYNIPNDLNPTSLFQDTFSKLTDLVKNFSPTGSGILPWWILYPMIFLILFRMLRH